MLSYTTFIRNMGALAVLLPLAGLGSACSDDADSGSPTDAEESSSGGKFSSGGSPSESDADSGNTSNGRGVADSGSATSTGGLTDSGGVAGGDASGGGAADSGDNGGTKDTGAALGTTGEGPAPVVLGTAGNYVILAKSAISNVPTSAVTGDLALSPAAASYITGFSLTKAGAKWTAAQVLGGIFAADNDAPTPTALTTAVADMQAAYTDAAGRPTPAFLNLGGGAIGGLTLNPGLYRWTSTVTIPADVTLDGGADDTWIFQISGDLTMGAAKSMTLSGDAQAKNIVWQVAGNVELGTTAHAEGIVLSKTAITLGAGSSINGRLLAQTAVNIASATVTAP